MCLLVLSLSIFVELFFFFFFFHPELNTGQIQEGVGEAINGIVKHFHKPEKEVRDGSLDRPKHVLLLFITNGEKSSRLLRWPPAPLSNCSACIIVQI